MARQAVCKTVVIATLWDRYPPLALSLRPIRFAALGCGPSETVHSCGFEFRQTPHLFQYNSTMENLLYYYKATIVRWIDGDTVEFYVDLGFYHFFGSQNEPLTGRIVTIDAPEKNEENFSQANEFVNTKAPVGSTVLIRTHRRRNGDLTDNFGRYLISIHLEDGSLADSLVAAGLGVYEDYN